MTAKKNRKPPAPAGRRVSKAEIAQWMLQLDQIDLAARCVRERVAVLQTEMAKARSK